MFTTVEHQIFQTYQLQKAISLGVSLFLLSLIIRAILVPFCFRVANAVKMSKKAVFQLISILKYLNRLLNKTQKEFYPEHRTLIELCLGLGTRSVLKLLRLLPKIQNQFHFWVWSKFCSRRGVFSASSLNQIRIIIWKKFGSEIRAHSNQHSNSFAQDLK